MLQDWRISELSPGHMGSIIGEKSSSGNSLPWSPPTLLQGRELQAKALPVNPGHVAVTHCLCLLHILLRTLAWRAAQMEGPPAGGWGGVGRRKVRANHKTQPPFLPFPVGRMRGASPPEQQLSNETLFKMFSNSCAFKGF